LGKKILAEKSPKKKTSKKRTRSLDHQKKTPSEKRKPSVHRIGPLEDVEGKGITYRKKRRGGEPKKKGRRSSARGGGNLDYGERLTKREEEKYRAAARKLALSLSSIRRL